MSWAEDVDLMGIIALGQLDEENEEEATMSERRAGKMVVENAGVTAEEELEVRVFPEGVTPAVASVKVGGTFNTGNYESLRVDVFVSLPCYEEDVEDTLRYAGELAEAKFKTYARAIRERKGGK